MAIFPHYERDILSRRCRAYRILTNIVAAEHAGKSESAREEDMSFLGRQATVRAEVLLHLAHTLGVDGLLGFRRMLAALEQGDYEQAASALLNTRWAMHAKAHAVTLAHHLRTGMRAEQGRGSAPAPRQGAALHPQGAH